MRDMKATSILVSMFTVLLCLDSCAFRNAEQGQARDEERYGSPVLTFTKEYRTPSGIETAAVLHAIEILWGLELLLTSDESFVVDHPERYTIELNADNGLFFRVDCNRGFGTYKADGRNLNFTIGGMTRAFCPPDPVEPHFLKGIGSATSFRVDDDYLILELLDGSATLKFVKIGKVFESRAGGIRFIIPAAWRDGWYAIQEEYGSSDHIRQSRAQYRLTFSYLPVSTDRSGQRLMTIMIFQKSDWKDILKETGPPPGRVLRESEDLVYVASPPRSNPFSPDSVDGIRYGTMHRSINELLKSFKTVQTP